VQPRAGRARRVERIERHRMKAGIDEATAWTEDACDADGHAPRSRIILAIGLVLAAIIATMALLLEAQWWVIQWTR
jgi:hypothetical protein